MANQVVTLRNFYTAEITPRAKKAGMELGYDFRHVRLLSRFPFPHRAADSKLDTFQSQALAALEKDPKTPVHSVEDINGPVGALRGGRCDEGGLRGLPQQPRHAGAQRRGRALVRLAIDESPAVPGFFHGARDGAPIGHAALQSSA